MLKDPGWTRFPPRVALAVILAMVLPGCPEVSAPLSTVSDLTSDVPERLDGASVEIADFVPDVPQPADEVGDGVADPAPDVPQPADEVGDGVADPAPDVPQPADEVGGDVADLGADAVETFDGGDADDGPIDMEPPPPQTCLDQNAECDGVWDGDTLVYCGECGPGLQCGIPEPNRCGRPAVCTPDVECGFVLVGSNLVYCGGCSIGEACSPLGVCEPSVRPFDWGPLMPWSWVIDTYPRAKAISFPELGDTWIYMNTYYWHDFEGDFGCDRIGRVRAPDGFQPDHTTLAKLQSSNFEDVPETICNATATVCGGWVSPIKMRRDGLEMFFNATYPCTDWEDPELYLSFRASVHEPWSKPVYLEHLSTRLPTSALWDPLTTPVLLPDNRTLIYRRVDTMQLWYARRDTDTPGDAGFQPVAVIWPLNQMNEGQDLQTNESLVEVIPVSVGCDGTHLIYWRVTSIGTESRWLTARIVPLLDLDPLTFGQPAPYEPALQGNEGSGLHHIAERADCGMVSSGDTFGLYYSLRQ